MGSPNSQVATLCSARRRNEKSRYLLGSTTGGYAADPTDKRVIIPVAIKRTASVKNALRAGALLLGDGRLEPLVRLRREDLDGGGADGGRPRKGGRNTTAGRDVGAEKKHRIADC